MATLTVIESSQPSLSPHPDMIWIPGGTFQMGSNVHYPEEAPQHRVKVDGFWLDHHPITNAQFREFIQKTGHVTLAEIEPNPDDYPGALPEMLFAGSLVFRKPERRDRRSCSWWHFIEGANWRHPYGPDSSIEGKDNHPVVHVAYRDVEAFCRWIGKDLPTEAEWEFAARGGLDGKEFAWGDDLYDDGHHMANTWQGEFPWRNTCDDGYDSTSPVGAFPPNGYGLIDMIGNVWEWTKDWYAPAHSAPAVKTCCAPANPRGAAEESSFDPHTPDVRIPRKVLKGGSHLCSPNFCRRYRPAARFPHPIDTSTCHVGFRCAAYPAG